MDVDRVVVEVVVIAEELEAEEVLELVADVLVLAIVLGVVVEWLVDVSIV